MATVPSPMSDGRQDRLQVAHHSNVIRGACYVACVVRAIRDDGVFTESRLVGRSQLVSLLLAMSSGAAGQVGASRFATQTDGSDVDQCGRHVGVDEEDAAGEGHSGHERADGLAATRVVDRGCQGRWRRWSDQRRGGARQGSADQRGEREEEAFEHASPMRLGVRRDAVGAGCIASS
jgi:hypothetical protein